jgi:hypothetical protein
MGVPLYAADALLQMTTKLITNISTISFKTVPLINLTKELRKMMQFPHFSFTD